jgi:hypothetical protein
MFVTGGQDLTGGVVHQHPGACLDGRRRHGDGKIISGKGARNARSEQSYSNKKTAFQRHILKIYRFAVLFTEVLLSYHGLIARKYDTINALLIGIQKLSQLGKILILSEYHSGVKNLKRQTKNIYNQQVKQRTDKKGLKNTPKWTLYSFCYSLLSLSL